MYLERACSISVNQITAENIWHLLTHTHIFNFVFSDLIYPQPSNLNLISTHTHTQQQQQQQHTQLRKGGEPVVRSNLKK